LLPRSVDLLLGYVDLHRLPHLMDLRPRAYQITGSLLVWENGGSNLVAAFDCAAALERVYHVQALDYR
jgi:hypothetical protein